MNKKYNQIVEQGKFFIVSDYSFKDELVKLFRTTLLEAIAKFQGEKIASEVESQGLEYMHRFVSPDAIVDLQDALSQTIKSRMLRYSYSFGKECLGLGEDFYLDISTIGRINFPFEIAKRSALFYSDYCKKRGRTKFNKDPNLTAGYHAHLPFPAWHHGPHYDSQFGHSFDGINLWWSIAGVNKENGMAFYPSIVCDPNAPFKDEPPYLDSNYPLPKPTFFNLEPGEVIAFNSDTLHGTRINLSDQTRVSFSSRLNPWKPRFDKHYFRHVRYWLKASELATLPAETEIQLPQNESSYRKDGTHPKQYSIPFEDVPQADGGNHLVKNGPSYFTRYNPKRKVIVLKEAFRKEASYELCQSDTLRDGEKAEIQFLNGFSIILLRSRDRYYALSSKCPHVGYDLVDGAHDSEYLYCPGHAAAFDLNSGKSLCQKMALNTYLVEQQKGRIYLNSARKRQSFVETMQTD